MKPLVTEANTDADHSEEDQSPFEIVEVVARVTEDDLEGKNKIKKLNCVLVW